MLEGKLHDILEGAWTRIWDNSKQTPKSLVKIVRIVSEIFQTTNTKILHPVKLSSKTYKQISTSHDKENLKKFTTIKLPLEKKNTKQCSKESELNITTDPKSTSNKGNNISNSETSQTKETKMEPSLEKQHSGKN